ncbi:transcriptional regulator, TetR family [Paenibacillus curdlanolyticus YK9]|uniref:Transcriptional regulator, TetR family n=1 Tax=Paenibacillus curdlanolyticus YK9 TaxID=717606 RepID=E0I681_9BACL|nr:TetR family transcriptional regulator [Paenibacillus curdlanolyticus]EFM12473.1 transcriptional regulator, TetR family [Paenibacillus curdlanolyticus YK9]
MPTIRNELDPRVIRTRQLIQDAFESLIRERDFDNITVRDITERAKVNRATFYAHFTDKYDILESTITAHIMNNIANNLIEQAELNEETITKVFLALCEYHSELNIFCQRSYKSLGPIIESQIKIKLQQLFFDIMQAKYPQLEAHQVMTASTMLSWAIYGAAYSWNNSSCVMTAEAYVEQAIPLIIHGANGIIRKG